jgi:hypothetical protein
MLPTTVTTAEDGISPRLPASAVPAITGLRISPHGAVATLVNISETGLLAECRVRIQPGSNVTLTIEGTFVPQSISGRISRNSVSSLGTDGHLRYHVGIVFNQRITLPDQPAIVVEPDLPAIVGEDPAAVDLPASTAIVAPVPPLRNRW